LKLPEIAQMVVDTLNYGADKLRYYDLHSYVVMPNHVHVLLSPLTNASKLLQSVKGFSAREANKILTRSGEPFWQPESYDHWVRDAAEFERIRRYIEEHPVRAGLAAKPEEYSWTSAFAAPAP
jgi:REP element-mobilizing transposase RayT